MTTALPHSAAFLRAASLPAASSLRGGEPFSCGVTRGRGIGPDKLTVQIATFNTLYPIGTAGFLLRDNGTVTPTVVEEPAIVLAGHIAVARFAGLRGFFSIERFTTGDTQP